MSERSREDLAALALLFSLIRVLVGTAIGLAVIYAGGIGLLYLNQRSMLYFAQPGAVSPERVDPGRVQSIRLRTSDGETLQAWYMAPEPGRPVILFFDGNGGNGAVQGNRWRRVAQRGVGLLTFKYRGYPGSTGRPSEAGLNRDARAAYAFLAARHPPDQIVLHGLSLGTGVAVRLATEVPARALILEAPYTSTVDVAELRFPFVPARLLMQDRYESSRRIGDVTIPVLIVHGERDSVIPVEMGRRLAQLARPGARLVVIPGGDHNTLARDGLYDHVWAFLGLEEPRAAATAGADESPLTR